MTDFILENLRLAGESGPQSLRIAQGRIVERGPGAGALEDDLPRRDCGGYLACAGFVDSHIHLDKALILDRCPICEGTLAEAVRLGHSIVVMSRRPGEIREVVHLETPLDQRHYGDSALEEKQKYLWQLMREEARAADAELVHV